MDADLRDNVLSIRIGDTSLEAVDLLVDAGIAQSRSEAASQLLSRGIDTSEDLLTRARQLAADLEGIKEELFEAVRSKDAGKVQQLLDEHPRAAAVKAETGESPLLMAVYYGAADVADLLRDRKDAIDVFEAAAVGDTRRLRELLTEHDAAVHEFSDDGWTPLHLTAHFGNREAAEILLEQGADPALRSRNRMKNTPLHAALAGDRTTVARFLIDSGAPVDAQDKAGYTPLHLAAAHGDSDMVAHLLEAGASPDTANSQDQTPADLARAEGFDAVVSQLTDAGADAGADGTGQ